MLNENQVIDAVCEHLRQSGFLIRQRLTTSERGVDIIAENPKTKAQVYIEAKGGISSKEASADFGNPYGGGKTRHQVAFGVFTALTMYTTERKNAGDTVGIAFPDSASFRKYLSPVKPILDGLKISVFMVDDSGKVRLFSKDELA